MLRVFLVDDEPPARARMRQLLAGIEDVIVVGEATDAIEAREAITRARPDVVFLDIEMPQVSGTALAQSLPEPRPFVVFATAFERYAVDAFAVEAADYLLKPITRSRLSATLTRIRTRLSQRTDLERDLRAASAVQAALLPQVMPIIGGYDLAALTRAARGVSGDFFVAQQLDSSRYVLALGDVAGKGLPAGLVASSLQARIEAVARHAAATASEIVADVNQTLCATSEGSRFATLVYLELDRLTNELTIVNAGHLPAMLVSADGEPEGLSSTGPALGLMPTAGFPAQIVVMNPGASLVVVSDGVTEAFNTEDEEFGDARLMDVIQRHASQPAAVLSEAIVAAVRAHAPGVAGDDVTVLVLKRS